MGPFHSLLDQTTSWPAVISDCRLLVAFGGVPLRNGQINAGGVARHCQRDGMLEAVRRGIRFVNVSPLRSDLMAGAGADWLPIRPGTDVAAMLGIAHTLFTERPPRSGLSGQVHRRVRQVRGIFDREGGRNSEERGLGLGNLQRLMQRFCATWRAGCRAAEPC